MPFLYGGVVREHGWLTDQQFLDAVAVAMITPGPVVITVAFIGYLIAGHAGAMLAALGVFLPCWLFVVIPAPYYNRFADDPVVPGNVRRALNGEAFTTTDGTWHLAYHAYQEPLVRYPNSRLLYFARLGFDGNGRPTVPRRSHPASIGARFAGRCRFSSAAARWRGQAGRYRHRWRCPGGGAGCDRPARRSGNR